MSKIVNRRDLLKLAGGSALGMLLTPLPWKLIDDTAIWTQNWSLTPPLPRGHVSFRSSACTLCPANCPVRARCAGALPVSLSGVPGHPFGDATLCPIGLAGHHMAFHPARIRQPWRRVPRGEGHGWQPATGDEVMAGIARRFGASPQPPRIGVLDSRPGRCASELYRGFLSRTPDGTYLRGHHSEDAALWFIRRRTTPDPGPLAYDLANSGMIISFGAPLFGGWGSPAVTRKVFDGARPPLLVQVGSRRSGPASRADVDLMIRPGSEEIVALALGRLLLEEQARTGTVPHPAAGLDGYRAMVERCTPDVLLREAGVDESRLREVARLICRQGQAVVIGGSDPAGGPPTPAAASAIAALNVLSGAVNAKGGIIPRAHPAAVESNAVDEKEFPDLGSGALDLLIIDDAGSGAAIPEQSIRAAVDPERGLVIAFSPFLAGDALAADIVIPVSAPYESAVEVYAPPTDPRWAMGLAAPLHESASPHGGREVFLGLVGRALGADVGALPGPDELVKKRLSAVAASGEGELFRTGVEGGAADAVPGDADALHAAMLGGAWWILEPEPPGRRKMTTLLPAPGEHRETGSGRRGSAAQAGLLLSPVGWKGATGRAAVPALLSKLYQESDLRYSGGHASVNPATALEAGVGDRTKARIVTRLGSIDVTVHHDSRVMPGVIEMACGPLTRRADGTRDPLSICETRAGGGWDATDARLEAL